jgi:hypothetical protein
VPSFRFLQKYCYLFISSAADGVLSNGRLFVRRINNFTSITGFPTKINNWILYTDSETVFRDIFFIQSVEWTCLNVLTLSERISTNIIFIIHLCSKWKMMNLINWFRLLTMNEWIIVFIKTVQSIMKFNLRRNNRIWRAIGYHSPRTNSFYFQIWITSPNEKLKF